VPRGGGLFGVRRTVLARRACPFWGFVRCRVWMRQKNQILKSVLLPKKIDGEAQGKQPVTMYVCAGACPPPLPAALVGRVVALTQPSPHVDFPESVTSRSSAPAIIIFVRCSVSQRCSAIHFSASAWDRNLPKKCGFLFGHSIFTRQ